jgi:hypothetical protein
MMSYQTIESVKDMFARREEDGKIVDEISGAITDLISGAGSLLLSFLT